eukprot:5713275-Amphidinium_carterae.1
MAGQRGNDGHDSKRKLDQCPTTCSNGSRASGASCEVEEGPRQPYGQACCAMIIYNPNNNYY